MTGTSATFADWHGLPDDDPPCAASSQEATAPLSQQNDLARCLWPLLRGLNFTGHPRHVAEALPHSIDRLDLTGFLNAMAVLGFRGRTLRCRLDHLDRRLTPCLFVPDRGAACVPLGSCHGVVTLYDGGVDRVHELPNAHWQGTAYTFTRAEPDRADASQGGWFARTGERFRSAIAQVLGLTLMLNVLALATPLFVMAVYDNVIASGSLPTLGYLAGGLAVAIAGDQLLRLLRARVLAFVGARLDNIVSTAVFQKVLSLPPPLIERSTIGAQLARLRDFENVREFFTGPMALAILELPFTAVLLAALALIAGPVALVPLAMFAAFGVLGLVLIPVVRRRVTVAARAGARRQEFLAQMLGGLRSLKYGGAESVWAERYRDVSADAVMAGFRMGFLSAVVGDLSHVLMVGAGAATMVVGVFRVFDGAMTVGALIAAMILVWRVLAPLQVAFVTVSRFAQIQSSVAQIDALMTLKAERDPALMFAPLRKIEGRITFSRVSMRYTANMEPALVGVDFEVLPGEVCAVVGPSGAGKSSVLRLLLGMYQPQAGTVRLDGRDIRQIDPVELRHLIGYQPQVAEFFYGTLAQNLRLARPDASDEDLARAAERAGLLDAILDLPDGFATRVGDGRTQHLSDGFCQQLNLARALVKQAPVLLLDEPGSRLDEQGDRRLTGAIERLRGRTTVLLVTHRPSHLKFADRILWLDRGWMRAFGPAADLLPKLSEDTR